MPKKFDNVLAKNEFFSGKLALAMSIVFKGIVHAKMFKIINFLYFALKVPSGSGKFLGG